MPIDQRAIIILICMYIKGTVTMESDAGTNAESQSYSNKKLPSYSEMVAMSVPQPEDILSETTAQTTPVTSQPKQDTIYHRQSPAVSAESTTYFAAFWCVVCCICATPLTLTIFVPAIILSVKVHNII